MTMKKIENIISIWKIKNLKQYKEIAEENMIKIFNLNPEIKKLSFNEFIENKDHWLTHTYNVFKKSLEIAEQVEQSTWIKVNTTLLYIMSGMHDSWRFRIPIIVENDTDKQIQAKQRKKKKAEQKHNIYGIAQIKLAIRKLKEKNIEINKSDEEKIIDYIYNHDFLNTRLDWENYKEPNSLEGQITRLSDRISTPIEQEIWRYRETGKRLQTPYFKSDISFEERIDFNFNNMGNYIKNGHFDEFTFFLALLSQDSKDFSNSILADIYKKWSSTKEKGIKKILDIAKKEWYPSTDILLMENLINKYIEHFWIKF